MAFGNLLEKRSSKNIVCLPVFECCFMNGMEHHLHEGFGEDKEEYPATMKKISLRVS